MSQRSWKPILFQPASDFGGGSGGWCVGGFKVLLSFFLHFGRRISTMGRQRLNRKLTKERLQTKVLTKEEGVLSRAQEGKDTGQAGT